MLIYGRHRTPQPEVTPNRRTRVEPLKKDSMMKDKQQAGVTPRKYDDAFGEKRCGYGRAVAGQRS